MWRAINTGGIANVGLPLRMTGNATSWGTVTPFSQALHNVKDFLRTKILPSQMQMYFMNCLLSKE